MSTANRGIMSHSEWRSPTGRLIALFYLFVLTVVSILFVFPFIFSFTAGLKNSLDVIQPGTSLWPETPLWGNYLDAWTRFGMSRLFTNTFIAAGGGVVALLAVSSLAAYSLSRLKPIGKNIIRAILFITVAVPRGVFLVSEYSIMAKPFPFYKFLRFWISYSR